MCCRNGLRGTCTFRVVTNRFVRVCYECFDIKCDDVIGISSYVSGQEKWPYITRTSTLCSELRDGHTNVYNRLDETLASKPNSFLRPLHLMNIQIALKHHLNYKKKYSSIISVHGSHRHLHIYL